MRRVLVLFAHPALHRSVIHRRLRREIEGLDGVHLHDLYAVYPDLVIDPGAEQQLVEACDVLVMQHPFYWYSSPAALKEWQDIVLQIGWAYGPDAEAFHGKLWLSAVSTGGSQHAYQHDGHSRFTMRELLRPFEQTATLCGAEYLPPFVVHGAHGLRQDEDLQPHAVAYRELLEGLRDETLDLRALRRRSYANRDEDQDEDRRGSGNGGRDVG